MTQKSQTKIKEIKILVIGAGFAGVRCASDLSNRHIPGMKIILVNPTPHFEYHAGLYRVLTGRSPLEVCVPLREIFGSKRNVEIVEDYIVSLQFKEKRAIGQSGSIYRYDYLVLAMGSETNYFDIEGLKDYSYSMKSIKEALALKKHIHEVFMEYQNSRHHGSLSGIHVVVIGGGPSGVEISGELAVYLRRLAKKHFIDPSAVCVDLVSASERLLPKLPQEVSEKVRYRLGSLGVNVYPGRRVMKETIREVYLKDMRMMTKTVIWCAGVTGNHLYAASGLPVNYKQLVLVDSHLRPLHPKTKTLFSKVFVAGDGAATKYSGMAQTANYDGSFIAEQIVRDLYGFRLQSYDPETVDFIVPAGPHWAAAEFLEFTLFGRVAWYLKRVNDLRFFLSVLPFPKALAAWRQDGVLWETCSVCNPRRI